MNELEELAFERLFKEAYQKYFGHPMTNPLPEIESKLFSDEIKDKTGLFINAKSLSNYAAHILCTPESREANPSISTVDTLVRYIVSAPHTNEEQRKEKESHYPYWFKYRDDFSRSIHTSEKKGWLFPLAIIFMILIMIAILLVVFFGVGQTPRST